jgi:manganese transport system ATP-binding protein
MPETTPFPPLDAVEVTVERDGVLVLDQVCFTAGPGSIMGVVGPNGAGKSTLFNVITSLMPATSGQVLIHGKTTSETRGLVAYVLQQEQINWRLPMNVWDVAMLGRVRRIGWFRRPRREDREATESALRQVGMWERRKSLLGELSGGQRQRVSVARALAQGADILLLDEPFRGVDISSQAALVSVLMELRDAGHTIMMSSHNISLLANYCDECLCLNCRVYDCGPPQKVLTPESLTVLYGPTGAVPPMDHSHLEEHVGHHH